MVVILASSWKSMGYEVGLAGGCTDPRLLEEVFCGDCGEGRYLDPTPSQAWDWGSGYL